MNLLMKAILLASLVFFPLAQAVAEPINRVEELIKLAQHEFGEPTDAEKYLLRQLGKSETADFTRASGQSVSDTEFTVGIRAWF